MQLLVCVLITELSEMPIGFNEETLLLSLQEPFFFFNPKSNIRPYCSFSECGKYKPQQVCVQKLALLELSTMEKLTQNDVLVAYSTKLCRTLKSSL